jgi:nucleotide-binding universal stress UspA family protein
MTMENVPGDNQYRLVVGVDGSPASRCALRWAVRQAELTGGAITAITAWGYPIFYGMEAAGAFDDIQHAAEQTLAETVAQTSHPAVTIHQEVTQGHAAEALLEAAKNADLLVIGSRGHGGFAGILLGSVSQHCAQHSACPVVIVREPPDQQD